jgi:hypothetical protein
MDVKIFLAVLEPLCQVLEIDEDCQGVLRLSHPTLL